jgi:hypothetical protein
MARRSTNSPSKSSLKSSPTKATKASSPPSKIISPTKKKLSSITVKSGSSRIRNRICCEALGHPSAALSRFWTQRVEGADAFNYPITTKVEDGTLRDDGFIMNASTRTSLMENLALKNTNNDYNRRSFPRITSVQDRPTRAAGQAVLHAILVHPDNNRYNSIFSATEEDDYTVVPHRFPDEVLLDAAIVDLIYAMYDNVDNEWFDRFPELARTFFSPTKPFPRCAIIRLGYPELFLPVPAGEGSPVLGGDGAEDVDDGKDGQVGVVGPAVNPNHMGGSDGGGDLVDSDDSDPDEEEEEEYKEQCNPFADDEAVETVESEEE